MAVVPVCLIFLARRILLPDIKVSAGLWIVRGRTIGGVSPDRGIGCRIQTQCEQNDCGKNT